ncbi:MAG: Gfo/Idh/MocA family protein [Candidatus Sumerlaeota bacterium]
MKKPTLFVVGAGGRGTGYSRIAAKEFDRARVTAVAEPREAYRRHMVETHDISPENTFTDWREAVDKPQLADAVIIATQDAGHTEPALAFIEKGYHVLLEKPMAPTVEECQQIVAAAKAQGVLFAVCHVLRYTAYTKQVKDIVDSGLLGDIVSIQHLEPIASWHFAHSYVRGNWRNEAESSFMLLAKSCHDIDWICHVMDAPVKTVSSFGSLYHFRHENQPEGATDRCLSCGVERQCPYSAKRIYLDPFEERGHVSWPTAVLAHEINRETLIDALEHGPYGRCVYASDNDVADHQVVNMEFADGGSAGFTVTAFCNAGERQTRLFGTRGDLRGDGRHIELRDFLTGEFRTIDTHAAAGTITGGHGGGDQGLMDAFLEALENKDPTPILSGPDATLESHTATFAAEKSRKEHRLVEIAEM